jgi:hypothetical protein
MLPEIGKARARIRAIRAIARRMGTPHRHSGDCSEDKLSDCSGVARGKSSEGSGGFTGY